MDNKRQKTEENFMKQLADQHRLETAHKQAQEVQALRQNLL